MYVNDFNHCKKNCVNSYEVTGIRMFYTAAAHIAFNKETLQFYSNVFKYFSQISHNSLSMLRSIWLRHVHSLTYNQSFVWY